MERATKIRLECVSVGVLIAARARATKSPAGRVLADDLALEPEE